MYVPSHNRVTDRGQLLAFMRRYSFATLVTNHEGSPFATHLPFMVDETNGEFVLKAHMARANPQWRSFGNGDALTIFTGPHAYISASWYEKPDVPTWNYTAVHATGRPHIVEDLGETLELGRRLSALHEGMLPPQPMPLWQTDVLDPDYRDAMLRAIVAFEIPVAKLEGKYKLSQNRSETDRRSVVGMLERFKDPGAREVAALMKATLEG